MAAGRPVAVLAAPLVALSTPPQGVTLATATGHIDGAPIEVRLTADALIIAFARQQNQVFAVNLQRLLKTAVDAVETDLTIPEDLRT